MAASPSSIIIAEHHPLRSRDEQVIKAAKLSLLSSTHFHLSLDNPLLVHFSGDSIQQLFRRMALMKRLLSHSFVTSAIRQGRKD